MSKSGGAQFTPGTCQCRWSGAVNFVMCPLHTAAPATYEALQAMLEGILYTRGASMSEDRWRTLTTIAKQALAQAEGKL